eukprot:gene5812-6252_t
MDIPSPSSIEEKDRRLTAEDSDEDIEWEEWKPGQISFYHHMLAGSIAGLAEHITLFPVDTIKTNLQCEKCGSTSPFNCAARMIKNEGVFRLWRGVTATFAGCVPAHAAYFSIYEMMKIALKADNKDQHQPFRAALCGAAAATAHDLFMNPFDVIKQRMQLGYYRSAFHCARVIARSEGISAFYLSFPTTLMTNVPHGCFVVAANESARKILNPSGEYNVMSSLMAGCVAGGFAAACTTPLDVIKTRLQTQDLVPCHQFQAQLCNTNNNNLHSQGSTSVANLEKRFATHFLHYSKTQHYHTVPELPTHHTKSDTTSPIQALRNNYRAIRNIVQRIISEEGYGGFWRGVGPRVVNQAPAVAISWTVYETAKSALGWKPVSL